MKIKLLISLTCFVILSIFAVHFAVKHSDNIKDNIFFIVTMIGVPLIIPFIVSLFKRRFFHPIFWICTILLFSLIVYAKYFDKAENENYLSETNSVIEYFDSKTGFFTFSSPIILFNQDVDSINMQYSKVNIIKYLYRKGGKGIENFYIGKVKVDNGKIVKEYYDLKLLDNLSVAKNEFGNRLNDINQYKPFLDTLIGK